MSSIAPRQIPDIGNFQNLINDVAIYNSSALQSPVEIPRKFVELEKQLKQAGKVLSSSSYTENFVLPLIKHLNERADKEEKKLSDRMKKMYISGTSSDFYSETSAFSLTDSDFFSSTTSDKPISRVILTWSREGSSNKFEMELDKMEQDAIKAVLLHGKACSSSGTAEICKTTVTAQMAIIRLYNDFINCEHDRHVQFCQQSPSAPLLSWGNGPATWTEEHTRTIGLKNVAIVNLPIGNSEGGIFAWTTLAHEVSGHDLLAAANLIDELYKNVGNSLASRGISLDVVNYWTSKRGRIDEIASDILGVINLGPAAAIGLVGYLKGLSPDQKLRFNGPVNDDHPADILRGVVVATTTNQLAIQNRARWANLIYREVLNDWPKIGLSELSSISLDTKNISCQEAMRSAEIVADSILNDPLENLDGMSLRQVRVWDMYDQRIADRIGEYLSGLKEPPEYCSVAKIERKYAKHIIAAATIESLKDGADSKRIFSRMITLLKRV